MTSGGRVPDGTNGLSTRLMWRSGGAGELYAYLPSSERVGTSFERGAWHWQPGHWHTIVESVSLNDPGGENGSIRVVVDERAVVELSDVVFRTTSTLMIEGIFFSTFFGGSDTSWASPRDQHVDFAGFCVAG
jgi:hypothetical protein